MAQDKKQDTPTPQAAAPEPETAAPKPTPNPSALTAKDKRDINKAVQTTDTSVMNPIEYNQMKVIARDMWEARALPGSYDNMNQVFMAIQLGKQMGFAPHEAITNGYYVDGKYQVYGKAIPSALRRHGWRWQFSGDGQKEVNAKLTNVDTGEVIEDTYTFEEAKLSGFTVDRHGRLKFGWKEGANRKRKLRYGVLSQIVHTYLPDVLGAAGGIAEYTEDYLEGEVVEDAKGSEQEAIEEKVKAFKGSTTLQDTKPKAVEV